MSGTTDVKPKSQIWLNRIAGNLGRGVTVLIPSAGRIGNPSYRELPDFRSTSACRSAFAAVVASGAAGVMACCRRRFTSPDQREPVRTSKDLQRRSTSRSGQ